MIEHDDRLCHAKQFLTPVSYTHLDVYKRQLHDREVKRYFATGIAGLSVVADSLSAIKYAKVKPIRDEDGLVVDYEVEGDFPKYGNNDDDVDEIAVTVVQMCIRDRCR